MFSLVGDAAYHVVSYFRPNSAIMGTHTHTLMYIMFSWAFRRLSFTHGRGDVRRGIMRLAAVGGISEDRLRRIPRDQAF